MTLSIKGIATTTLTVLLSYLSSHPVLGITDTHIQPFPPTESLNYASALAFGVERSAIAQSITTDTMILPGERVGAVKQNTTRRELVKMYGSQRLRDFTMPGPEGIGSFAATRVNLGAQKSFTIVWSDSSRSKVSSVRDFGTAWKTPQGIGVGTTLTQLRQKLGEFKLFGLGWDYGGTVQLEKTRLSRYQGYLTLRVDAAQGAADKFPNDYQAVSGDGEFSATNPHWKPLGIKVEQMIVMLNR